MFDYPCENSDCHHDNYDYCPEKFDFHDENSDCHHNNFDYHHENFDYHRESHDYRHEIWKIKPIILAFIN